MAEHIEKFMEHADNPPSNGKAKKSKPDASKAKPGETWDEFTCASSTGAIMKPAIEIELDGDDVMITLTTRMTIREFLADAAVIAGLSRTTILINPESVKLDKPATVS